jgi:hypothetical protein
VAREEVAKQPVRPVRPKRGRILTMTKRQFEKHCELQALWWMAYAMTGACKSSDMYHGSFDGPKFTDEEKVKDALNTSQNHIRLYRESCGF